jgi:hypothetical protein
MNAFKLVVITIAMIIMSLPVGFAASVSVLPATQNLVVGSQFVLNVSVTPSTSIGAMQTDIIFDQTLVKIDSVTLGSMFGSNIFSNVGNISNANGKVTNVYITAMGGYTTSSTGTFATIRGTILKKGSSVISLSGVKIAKPDFTYDTVSIVNATVTSLYPAWDVNEDGIIDIVDLNIVASHFGETGLFR